MSVPSVTDLTGGTEAYTAHCGANSILSVLADCNATEHAHGRRWYRDAHRFCNKVSALTGKQPNTVAAVVARISPQVNWADNKGAALEVCSGATGRYSSQCYPDNILRAERIAADDSAEVIALEVLPYGKLLRPKISAFYRNIVAPECPNTVTVDSWAARIWIGNCLAPELRISAKESARIQADYIAAAALCSLLPQVLQAITWVGAHRIRKEQGQRNLFDFGLQFKI